MKNLKIHIIYLLLLFPACLFSQASKHQMRGVWIATVSNVDWPSKNTFSVEEQKKELVDMLNKLQSMNINTVAFQVRPAADAFYTSALEPWSHFLTGRQGKSPEPYYDPLEFFIQEAHARCMEAHVWLNPYRLSLTTKFDFDSLHPYIQKKHLVKEYGGKYYFDPGYKETRDYLNEVVADIVTRYDLDAIHIDDYFYPYKIKGKDFPDSDSFEKEPRGYKRGQKDDWRRNNVNLLIEELNRTIKSKKDWVEFGISPFGVWRNADKDPKGSKTAAGMTNYDDLYADVLKWMKEGTIDYVAPQLYWEIGKTDANYKVLIDWWANNAHQTNLYTGLFVSGLNVTKRPAWQRGNEITRQLKLNQRYKQQGVFLYSAKPFLNNPLGICDSLRSNYFKYPALVPVSPNIKGEASAQPAGIKVFKDEDNTLVIWNKVLGTKGKQVAYYVIYCFEGNGIGDLNNPQYIVGKTTDNFLDTSEYTQKLKEGTYTFVVTSVNRYKRESEGTDFAVKVF